MKHLKTAVFVSLLALVATGAKSQTFKSDFATKLVLAGGGTDPVNTLTLMATGWRASDHADVPERRYNRYLRTEQRRRGAPRMGKWFRGNHLRRRRDGRCKQ